MRDRNLYIIIYVVYRYKSKQLLTNQSARIIYSYRINSDKTRDFSQSELAQILNLYYKYLPLRLMLGVSRS